jgi:hypothetical protein
LYEIAILFVVFAVEDASNMEKRTIKAAKSALEDILSRQLR